jgi:hypothetical protein
MDFGLAHAKIPNWNLKNYNIVAFCVFQFEFWIKIRWNMQNELNKDSHKYCKKNFKIKKISKRLFKKSLHWFPSVVGYLKKVQKIGVFRYWIYHPKTSNNCPLLKTKPKSSTKNQNQPCKRLITPLKRTHLSFL